MADALLLPRRFLAPSPSASSSSRWVLSSPGSPRRARLAAARPHPRPRRLARHKVHSADPESSEQPKWWEKDAGPNMIDIHSTVEFLDALRDAGDRLVVVEFYGTWCGSCRALFPRNTRWRDIGSLLLKIAGTVQNWTILCPGDLKDRLTGGRTEKDSIKTWENYWLRRGISTASLAAWRSTELQLGSGAYAG